MRFIILTLLLSLSLLAKDKVALVIGNKNYTNQTGLKNPIKDAELIRDTLNGMGFEVLEAYNKDLNSLGDKLEEFIGKARNAKVAVVYYAGHGIGVGSKNYLIPLGATSLSKSNLSRKLLSVDELKEAVANAKGFGVVLFDACRNSFFSGSIAGLSSGRTSRALVPPTVTRANVLVSFSTQAGTKAEDDVNGGDHSPYAIALSENLKNNRDIRLVMGSIRTRVYGLTFNQQYPIEKNMLDGKSYCLSGVCQEIDNSENRRLREKIALLEQQRNVYVPPKVVVEEPVQVVHTTNGITQIGNRMYQNQAFTKEYTWEKAGEYCQGLTLGGYDNWRLPTRAELNKISNIKMYGKYDKNWEKWFDKNKHKRLKGVKNSHFVKEEFIDNMTMKYSWFWTSESKDSSSAWLVDFNDGDVYWLLKTDNLYALCVR
jgi:hypothetical protein